MCRRRKPAKLLKLELHVYFQNNDFVKVLQEDRAEALKRAEEWKQKHDRTVIQCADEQRVNLELIDLLRSHGIRYRPSADMRTW